MMISCMEFVGNGMIILLLALFATSATAGSVLLSGSLGARKDLIGRGASTGFGHDSITEMYARQLLQQGGSPPTPEDDDDDNSDDDDAPAPAPSNDDDDSDDEAPAPAPDTDDDDSDDDGDDDTPPTGRRL